MYTIFKSPVPSSRLGPWAKPLGKFREVIGFTALGTFFLRNPEDGTCIALYPLRDGNNASGIGKFADGAQFEREILGYAAMRDELCRPADVAQLEARLGPLEPEQVYFPVPYPFLGGSGELSTYDKGNAWVFANIVGQALGVDESGEPETTRQPAPHHPGAAAAKPKNWKRDPNILTLIVIAIGIAVFALVRYMH